MAFHRRRGNGKSPRSSEPGRLSRLPSLRELMLAVAAAAGAALATQLGTALGSDIRDVVLAVLSSMKTNRAMLSLAINMLVSLCLLAAMRNLRWGAAWGALGASHYAIYCAEAAGWLPQSSAFWLKEATYTGMSVVIVAWVWGDAGLRRIAKYAAVGSIGIGAVVAMSPYGTLHHSVRAVVSAGGACCAYLLWCHLRLPKGATVMTALYVCALPLRELMIPDDCSVAGWDHWTWYLFASAMICKAGFGVAGLASTTRAAHAGGAFDHDLVIRDVDRRVDGLYDEVSIV